MPDPVYDEERFLDDIDTFLKANLNTKIAEINAEKADSITLDTVSTDGFFLETLDDEVTNYDPYVFTWMNQLGNLAIHGGVARPVTVEVDLVIASSTDGSVDFRKIFRYHRALRELFEKNFAKIRPGLKIKVEGLEPIDLSKLDSSAMFRAVGVLVSTELL